MKNLTQIPKDVHAVFKYDEKRFQLATAIEKRLENASERTLNVDSIIGGIQSLKMNLNEFLPYACKPFKQRVRLIDRFFEKERPVDICVILNGGLIHIHQLANQIQKDNLLFYRPKTSHKKVINKSILYGLSHPERALLLFDTDIALGNALRETAEHFENLGYSRNKIFGYLYMNKYNDYEAELNHINKLLAIPDLSKRLN